MLPGITSSPFKVLSSCVWLAAPRGALRGKGLAITEGLLPKTTGEILQMLGSQTLTSVSYRMELQ